MKVAWFTPLDRKSAIAECSRLVVRELARHCEVDVWTREDGDLVDAGSSLVRYDGSGDLPKLAGYDHCVYNMGNYHPFHSSIFEAMKARPGVVVLHDFIMHHFFMVEYLHELRRPDLYVAEMERAYGAAGRDVAARSVSGVGTPVWLTDEVVRFPLFERIVDRARGVFVHSHFHRGQVQRRYLGDVGAAYLPYEFTPPKRQKAELLAALGLPTDRVLALSTGIVHPVKQIERALEAIAAQRALADRPIYVVVGGGEDAYRAKLESMAAQLGIAGSVRFVGYQPEDVLRGLLDAADFAINLRFPNSEGCSLSLIEQMSHANPVVALDSGMYGEMPDSAVIKVAVSDRGQGLARAIGELTTDASLRDRMGQEARAFAATHFSAQAYVRRLLDFLADQRSLSQEPVRASLREMSAAVAGAGYPIEKGTAVLEPLMREFHSIVGGSGARPAEGGPLRTLGIWLGFEHPTPLHREGLSRFLSYLLRHLIERHGVDCEIWCYSFNESSVQEAFRALLSDATIAAKIRIVHERNWSAVFASSVSAFDLPPEVAIEKNNLYELANLVSRADCFLLGICYLDNALPLAKPIFIPLHDLVVLESYRAFVGDNEGFRPYARKIREAVEVFNRQRAFFFCNSDHVRQKQLRKYIRHVDPGRTAVVYLPANVPQDIHRRIASESETRSAFGIAKPYFFYPTQVRHHKNVLSLLHAFKQLLDEKCDIQLVLTGSLEHVPACQTFFEERALSDRVVFARDVGEEALYALHAHATATIVPTLFEGGFPWQSLEAMLMDTPAIMSDIDAVSERVAAFGIDPTGLRRFKPFDVETLAAHMRDALADREGLVRDQQPARDALFRYQWDDVARAYFRVISDRLQQLAAAPGATDPAPAQRAAG
jgi:glycosyltransferase involved in cell wall biosynthesis